MMASCTSRQEVGASRVFGFPFDLVRQAGGGSPGPVRFITAHSLSWLEIRGQAGPLMGLIDSLERRFVFPGGMDDFILGDEVARVKAIKRLIFAWKPVFEAASAGKPHQAPIGLHPIGKPSLHGTPSFHGAVYSRIKTPPPHPRPKQTLKPNWMVLIYKTCRSRRKMVHNNLGSWLK